MNSTIVYPVDLQTKRQAKGDSQESFGQLLGVSRQQVQKYESGNFNIPTDKACESAILLGGITLRYRGIDFELKIKSDSNQQAPFLREGITPVTSTVIAQNEIREFLEHSNKLSEYAIAILDGEEHAGEYLVGLVKEGKEAKVSVQQVLEAIRRVNPEAYAKGMELAQSFVSRTTSVA